MPTSTLPRRNSAADACTSDNGLLVIRDERQPNTRGTGGRGAALPLVSANVSRADNRRNSTCV